MNSLSTGRIACLAIVKQCEANIAEWIAYQLALGFDTVILLDNLSTDGTREEIARFQARYDVRLFNWSQTSENYQREAYKFAVAKFRREFDWIAIIDCDEFLSLPPGRTLGDLTDVGPRVAAIAMPWAFFGSSGLVAKPKDLVIRSYLRRSESSFGPNTIVKSLARPLRILKITGPHGFHVRGDYVDMNHGKIRQPLFNLDAEPDYAGGKLHHYFCQSREDWARKMARGYHDTTRPDTQFAETDRNEVYDDSALARAGKVEEIISALDSALARVDLPKRPALLDRLAVFWWFGLRGEFLRLLNRRQGL